MFCKYCGTKNDKNSSFCKKCGKRIKKATVPKVTKFTENDESKEAAYKYCKHCGTRNLQESLFCKSCGRELKKELIHEVVKTRPRKVAIVLAAVMPVVIIGIILGVLGVLGVFGRNVVGQYPDETSVNEDEYGRSVVRQYLDEPLANEDEYIDLYTSEYIPDFEAMKVLEKDEVLKEEKLTGEEAARKAEELIAEISFGSGNTVKSDNNEISIEYPDGWEVDEFSYEDIWLVEFKNSYTESIGIDTVAGVIGEGSFDSSNNSEIADSIVKSQTEYEGWSIVDTENYSGNPIDEYYYYCVDDLGYEYTIHFIFENKCEKLFMFSSLSPSNTEFAANSIISSILDTVTCGGEKIEYKEEEEEEEEEVTPPTETVVCPYITNISFTEAGGNTVTTLTANSEYYAKVSVQGDASDSYYDWTEVPGGYIENNYGSYVRFYAPSSPGYYDITVCIYGSGDCTDCYAETVQVIEPEPVIECPEITDISFIDRDWIEFTTLETNCIYFAEVSVYGADTSDLYYDWTEVPGGYIENNYGSYIQFYAPSSPGYYDITVCVYGPDDCQDCYTETIEVVEQETPAECPEILSMWTSDYYESPIADYDLYTTPSGNWVWLWVKVANYFEGKNYYWDLPGGHIVEDYGDSFLWDGYYGYVIIWDYGSLYGEHDITFTFEGECSSESFTETIYIGGY